MIRCMPLIFILILFLPLSCNKSRLEIKPVQSQVTITSVADCQNLLDNQQYINLFRPYLGELGADNYYIPDNTLNSLSPNFKASYLWEKDPFVKQPVPDWNYSYATVNYANAVLEALPKLTSEANTDDYNNVKGQALFHRAHSYWQLAQIFCKPYNVATASSDLGLPLRLSTDFKVKVPRYTVEETYIRIINDLLQAADLLPQTTDYKTRPAKCAAYALLARVYLSMSDYDNSLDYANKSLAIYNKLMDYNTIANTKVPFTKFNDEVIWYAVMATSSVFSTNVNCPVDSNLYNSYDNNDLRKTLFFTVGPGGCKVFKGSYEGSTSAAKFSGIATDEMYLTRAECYARKNRITEAMNDMDTLLNKRWKTGTLQPLTDSTREGVLLSILTERRKELLYRGLRWTDLRRLNLANDIMTITPMRFFNNQAQTLPPNSPLYVYPIPEEELKLNPMPQNER